MPNLSKIYSDIIGKTELAEKRAKLKQQAEGIEVSPARDAARIQAKVDWLQSTITEEIFTNIGDEIQILEKQARDHACSYWNTNNHMIIITMLIRAAELRRFIEKYGKSN